MKKVMSRLALATAAVGLTVGPIAAHANTRAGDFGTLFSAPASAPGTARSADGENVEGEAGPIFLALIGGALIIAGIVIAEDDSDDDLNQSPGAN